MVDIDVVATVFLLSVCTWQFQDEMFQMNIKSSVQNENCIVLLAKNILCISLVSPKQHQQDLSCLSAWCRLLWEKAAMKKLPLCREASLFALVNKWLDIILILPGVSFPCKFKASLLMFWNHIYSLSCIVLLIYS